MSLNHSVITLLNLGKQFIARISVRIFYIQSLLKFLKTLTQAFIISISLLVVSQANAIPQGGNVAAGNATIDYSPNNVIINQSSDKAIINWNSFDIDSHEITQFNQPSSNSIALNRITNGNPTQILGQLSANGKIILINPAGILFGKDTRIDVASLLATTANIRDDDFMANRYHFEQNPNSTASITNMGMISAAEGGLVALVAPNVSNSGIINAKLGKITLASGDLYTVDLNGDQLIQFSTPLSDTNPSSTQIRKVENSGLLKADGGTILLTTQNASNLISNVINVKGIVEAHSVLSMNGKIVLTAGKKSTVVVDGTLDVSGKNDQEKGGTIHVLGEKVGLLAGANLNATGTNGGGTVLIGGDYLGQGKTPTAKATYVDPFALINASAISQGNGGKVIVWSNEVTRFYGSILATGGSQSGDGGFIETSSKQWLDAQGTVDAHSKSDKAGTWLLDPYDVIITQNTTSNGSFNLADPAMWESSGTPSQIAASLIATHLNTGTSVTIQTSSGSGRLGNITFDTGATISATPTTGVPTLTFDTTGTGSGSITFSEAINGAFNLVARADGGISVNAVLGGSSALHSVNFETTGGLSLVNLNSNITTSNGQAYTSTNGITLTGTRTFTNTGGTVLFNNPLNLSGGTSTVTTTSGNITLNGKSGNTLNLVGASNNANKFTVNGSISGTISVNGGGGTGIDALESQSGNNTWNITGSNKGDLNTNTTFINIEKLMGGNGDDNFVFTANSSKLSNIIDGGAGFNTLDYSGRTSIVTINLQNSTATNTGGFLAGTIQHFKGSNATGNDNLIGANIASTWKITDSNGGEVTNTNGTIHFSQFENLRGSANVQDIFEFYDNGYITGLINGNTGTGIDTLDYSHYSMPITVDRATGKVYSISGLTMSLINNYSNIESVIGNSSQWANNTLIGLNSNATWTLTNANSGTISSFSFLNFGNLVGGSATDTLVGANTTNEWRIIGTNSGTINQNSTLPVKFSSFENLTGGSQADDFKFAAGTHISGNIKGGTDSAIDAIDYSQYGTATYLNRSNSKTSGALGTFSGIEAVIGDSAFASHNILTGSNSTSTWNITGENTGNISGTFSFEHFGNLSGGTGVDTFKIVDNGGISGDLNGSSNTDVLDYSNYGSGVDLRVIGGNTGSNTTAIGGNWSNIEKIIGSTFDDSFNFTTTASSLSSTLSGGTAGYDTLTYSPTYTNNISINLNSNTATGTGGIAAGTIDNFVAGSGSTNTLTAANLPNVWIIDSNGNSLTTLSPSLSTTVAFSNFNMLTGGSNTDDFTINNGMSFTGNLAGGTGNNNYSLNPNSTLNGNITGSTGIDTFDLHDATVNGNVNGSSGNDSFQLQGNSHITGDLIGGTGTDTLNYSNYGIGVNIIVNAANAGAAASATGIDGAWTGIDKIIGSSYDDNFYFTTASASLSSTLSGGAGNDTLSYRHPTDPNIFYPSNVTINLNPSSSSTPINTATETGGIIANTIENFIAGGGTTNKITGPNLTNNWDINSSNSGNLVNNNGNFSFSYFNALTGGTGADNFTLAANTHFTGTLSGGTGNNTYTLNPGSALTGNINGNTGVDTFNLNNASVTGNLNGSSNNDLFTLNNSTVTGNLDGSSGNDLFQLSGSAQVFGNINGGSGTDTLNYSSYSFVVTVNQNNSTATGININPLTSSGGLYSGIQNFIGSALSDTFIGSNSIANAWQITAANEGNLNNSASFLSFESLLGGSNDDSFVFLDNGYLNGLLNGMAGINSLDYSNYPHFFIVKIPAHFASNVAGGVYNIQQLATNRNDLSEQVIKLENQATNIQLPLTSNNLNKASSLKPANIQICLDNNTTCTTLSDKPQ